MLPALARKRLLCLFSVVALAFVVRPLLIGGDEPHYAAMSASLAFDRDADLSNQYREIELAGSSAAGKRFSGTRLGQHLVEKANGPQFGHSLGLPMLAAPFVWIAGKILHLPWPDPMLGLLTVLSCLAGLAGLVALLGRFLGDDREGLFIAVLVFCSSPLWFYSRTFFTEPFVWSALAVGSWLLAGRSYLVGGGVLGLAVIVREPSLVIVVPVVLSVVVLAGWRAASRAVVGPSAGIALVLARNLLLNGGNLLDFPQPFKSGNVAAGSIGLLLDSSHGLLPFMPIAILAPIGFFLARSRQERVILGCSAAAFVSYFLLAAAWVDWRGGSCFGPRLVVPAIPLLAPAIALVWRRLYTPALRSLFLAVSAIGAGIEISAIASPFDAFWSAAVGRLVAGSGSALATFAAGTVLAFLSMKRLEVVTLRLGQRESTIDATRTRNA